jgi:hypothetical protein
MPYADPAQKKQRDSEYQKENRAHCTARQKAWRQDHRDRQRWYTLKWKYGITREDYDSQLERQGSVCAICSTADEGLWWGYFVVDHDHATGAIRGLLCSPCNTLIGGARDRTDVLRSAIAYLERGGGA